MLGSISFIIATAVAAFLFKIYEPEDKLQARRKINIFLLSFILWAIPLGTIMVSFWSFYLNVYLAKTVTPRVLTHFGIEVVIFVIGYSAYRDVLQLHIDEKKRRKQQGII